jgi:hypothetical protein
MASPMPSQLVRAWSAVGQGGDRVVDDVRGEQEEGDRDKLLRAGFGGLGQGVHA